MNPQMTTSYMAEQTNRNRLDQVAYQGWLAEEAAEHRDEPTSSGNSLLRFGQRYGWLVQQAIGRLHESTRAAKEAIVPNR